MKLFNSLIKIMTNQEDILPKAVFVENLLWNQWAYYIYYYNLKTNSFYINDLDYIWTENRTSATNIIENIATKIYNQEMKFSNELFKIYKNNKPKIFNFYISHKKNLIVDKVDLGVVRWDDWSILNFRIPTRNINNHNTLKLQEIREELSKFYLK